MALSLTLDLARHHGWYRYTNRRGFFQELGRRHPGDVCGGTHRFGVPRRLLVGPILGEDERGDARFVWRV